MSTRTSFVPRRTADAVRGVDGRCERIALRRGGWCERVVSVRWKRIGVRDDGTDVERIAVRGVRGFALWSERVDGWSVRWVGVRCAGERERESVRSERAGERERVRDFHAGGVSVRGGTGIDDVSVWRRGRFGQREPVWRFERRAADERVSVRGGGSRKLTVWGVEFRARGWYISARGVDATESDTVCAHRAFAV